MKFKIRVASERSPKGWWENYDKNDVDDAELWARQTIKRFNETLRPNESPRRLLEVVVIEAESHPDHAWVKTNNFTLQARDGSLYDDIVCTTCGITGRRYGLTHFVRDRKYKAKIYQRCDTAQVQLARLAARRAKSEDDKA